MGFNGELKTQLHGNPKRSGKRHAMPWAENGNKTGENDFVAVEFGIMRKNLHNSEKSSIFAALK